MYWAFQSPLKIIDPEELQICFTINLDEYRMDFFFAAFDKFETVLINQPLVHTIQHPLSQEIANLHTPNSR
jgi:hypothetical protein